MVALAPSAGEPSGLADLLLQFLDQLVADDPGKARQAARIAGQLLFRAAEDPAICVRLSFTRARVEVADHDGRPTRCPVMTADFLTTAHLTTGEESPLALVARRKLRVRCAPWHALFLWRVLALMRIPAAATAPAPRRPRWRWIALAVAVAIALGVIALALSR